MVRPMIVVAAGQQVADVGQVWATPSSKRAYLRPDCPRELFTFFNLVLLARGILLLLAVRDAHSLHWIHQCNGGHGTGGAGQA